MSSCRKGKPGADQRVFHFLAAAHANLAVVERRAFAARCGEDILAHRIVDSGGFHAALDLHADRNAKLREAVQEIGRAVERVDDPDGIGFALCAGFLGEDRVVGVVILDDFDDRVFCSTVGVTDEIVVSFLLDIELVELVEMPDEDGAATACCHHGHIL